MNSKHSIEKVRFSTPLRPVLVAGMTLGLVVAVAVFVRADPPQQKQLRTSEKTQPLSRSPIPAARLEHSPIDADSAPVRSVAIKAPEAPSAAQEGNDSVEPEETPLEAKARYIEEHQNAVRIHEEEPIDRRWASETEQTLGTDLSPLAKVLNFEVESIDCRTQTCVATLAFRSYKDANSGWMSILNLTNHAGCGTQVTLDDPVDPAQKYRTAVIYRCERGTGGLSE